uniref:uncharacterized protein LOC100396698 n=1 Tax=Callithrix jacchus TaxID=9483 RepID=UPI0023DD6688|nr:uncharacterized protein LOC100396698 [Callithrix jacchus]
MTGRGLGRQLWLEAGLRQAPTTRLHLWGPWKESFGVKKPPNLSPRATLRSQRWRVKNNSVTQAATCAGPSPTLRDSCSSSGYAWDILGTLSPLTSHPGEFQDVVLEGGHSSKLRTSGWESKCTPTQCPCRLPPRPPHHESHPDGHGPNLSLLSLPGLCSPSLDSEEVSTCWGHKAWWEGAPPLRIGHTLQPQGPETQGRWPLPSLLAKSAPPTHQERKWLRRAFWPGQVWLWPGHRESLLLSDSCTSRPNLASQPAPDRPCGLTPLPQPLPPSTMCHLGKVSCTTQRPVPERGLGPGRLGLPIMVSGAPRLRWSLGRSPRPGQGVWNGVGGVQARKS